LGEEAIHLSVVPAATLGDHAEGLLILAVDSRDRITFATFAVATLSIGLGIRTNIVIDDALQQQA
jgi:hypothetical protein